MESFGNSQQPIPERVTLVRPNPTNPSEDQLFIDQLPIPRDAWHYDAHDRILSWRGAFGGGQLHFYHSDRGAVGNIGPELDPCSVRASAKAQFSCAVALNCGASYKTSGNAVIGFAWDPTSAAWQSANWIQDRLLLTYTVTQGSSIEPPTFTFEFEDKETGAIPWDPGMGAFAASLKLGARNNQMVWNLTFKSSIAPMPDDGPNAPSGPDSVYPFWLQAVEDGAAATIDGVIEIDAVAPKGTLVGLQGTRVAPLATGYYRTSSAAAPFGIFDGRLTIGGQSLPSSRMVGSALTWSGLDSEHQRRTGLPESGSLRFIQDGSSAYDAQQQVKVSRLRGSDAIQAIAEHNDLHPVVHTQAVALQQTLAENALDIRGLLAMTPFSQQDGAWGDAVQAAVRQNLSDIMNSSVPADMWKLLFPNMPQPSLSGELAIVANSPVTGVPDPKAWYQSLATAVLTSGLAEGSDEHCANLNGPRARAWLKSQVATSAVYQAHGQELFQYQWQQRFPTIANYLADQTNNATAHQSDIDTQIQKSIADIQANVATDAGSDPQMKQKLIDEVKTVGEYAKTNKLYWAFAYYTYNTAPAILANIAIQMGIDTGSDDGTALTRLFQQNVTVLTALDPSGYFARQYNATINIFLATNILPSMYGFTGDASSFDIIKEYLQQLVNNNINSEDQDIAKAAAQIKTILDDEHADEMLQASMDALRSFSEAIQDALALPYVANQWVKWFSTTYPRFSSVANVFGSVFIGGITALAVFNLFLDFKSWSKLTAGQRAEAIINATQLGLQILAAVVKRGVRIYAIFNVDGMTALQRAGALNKILVTGEADALDQGLVRIGNNTARWLGDTEGSVGRVAEGEAAALLRNGAASEVEEASWAAKVFGKNLDEFIATRIGPIFILAGIGLSIYFISTGESGIALASDILNIVGGALMLFATIGGWLVEGGVIAAEGLMATILSFAGPLAILVALAGIALMLYEMFKKPPDPVKEFVDQYARPAGFYVSSKASSMDYAVPYANKDQASLLMIGFSLSSSTRPLSCNPDGSISLGQAGASALPNVVWQAVTDGLGLSQIFTIAQPDSAHGPVVLLLSVMSDNSVSFQPAKRSSSSTQTGPTVVTQTWLSHPQGNAAVTSDGNLVSLGLTFQPVLPDEKGKYAPSHASGWLIQSGSGVGLNANNGSTFALAMSGMAPNFMTMVNLNFLLNSTPSTQQRFSPSFGVLPSTPMSFALSGASLPTFLSFDPATGVFAPNGQQASTAAQASYTLTATNTLGPAHATFNISVAASTLSRILLEPAAFENELARGSA
jgi:hypothetical protein